jgi:two-component system, cell cycle response regulator
MSDDFSEKTSVITGDTFSGRLKAVNETPPAIVVLMGPAGYVGKQWPLIAGELVIGRAVESQIYIDDKSVSRTHARFNVTNGEVTVLDLGSSNKTMVNGDPLFEMVPYKLKNNDQIKTGNVIFKFLEKGNIEAITNQELNEKASKDALTGAFTKGALLERGPELVKRADFLNESLGVLMFDIDHFKEINDTSGHPAGDAVLKELGRIVGSKVVRAHDYFARYGGEEFVVLLSGSPQQAALEVAERLRATIETNTFMSDGISIHVTISIGVAMKKASESEWPGLLSRADEALYASKKSGRNKVTLAD